MKILFYTLVLFGFYFPASAQSILGKWQLVKESTCLEKAMTENDDSSNRLVQEMKSMSPATPRVVTFKEKFAGEDAMRILGRKRTKNNRSFLYRFDGQTLLILDKKSQTITDSYLVDKLASDSLIISNAARPCEVKVFIRLK